MEEQLAAGSMQNVRHLWTSVRPNGDNRPHDLNRLEIRICDLVSDPQLLLAITAFAELRLLQLVAAPDHWDPLRASRLSLSQLAALADSNDRASAQTSLDAELSHWRTGEPVRCRDWLATGLAELAPLALAQGLGGVLAPLHAVLEHGNQATRWLSQHRAGDSISAILSREVQEMAMQEQQLAATSHTDRITDVLG
jgi:predicted glutamate--cysteine ligase